MLRGCFTLLLILLALAEPLIAQSYERYEESHYQMGTEFRIVLFAVDAGIASESFAKSWNKLDALNLSFSDYDNASEVNLLCENYIEGQEHRVSSDLWRLLLMSQDLSAGTNGAFDVTIGPLTKLWRYGMRRQEVPDSADIASALLRVGHQRMRVSSDDSVVIFDQGDIQLDFGAIAKGFALDEIALLLQQSGVEHFLIDGGGDLLLGAAPPDRPG